MFLDSCEQCILIKNCPCGYSLHNAACLTLASDNIENYYNNLLSLAKYNKNKNPNKEID